MTKHYYNENNKDAAAWLRSLMDAEIIPYGDIDTRSIVDVKAHRYNRTIALHGLGNAIVPQVAAEFIKASMR